VSASVEIQDNRPPRPGRKLLGRTLIGFVLIALFVGSAVASAVIIELKDDISIFTDNSTPIAGLEKGGGILDGVDAAGAQTILLIGSDHRYAEGEESRSDTMMLVRLDPDKGQTTVMSVPRDLKVQVPGAGTQKLNAAYAVGGPKLTVKMLKGLLGTTAHPFEINNVININFGGFQQLLNRLGCVYADIDRHYFNDNNPPNGGGGDYATINVKAGYQKLCGNSGLDYVRFRHLDDDNVRAARQQDFLGQAKDQIGVGKVFEDRKALLKLFAKNTQSTIRDEGDVLSILKLAIDSAGRPVQEVQFPYEDLMENGIAYVTATPSDIHTAVTRFMNAESTPGTKGKAKTTAKAKKKKKDDEKKAKKQNKDPNTSIPSGLILNKTAGEDEAIALATNPDGHVTFPVYYPTLVTTGGRYVSGDRRAYVLRDRDDKRHQAYRIVVSAGEIGQYYGLQGTTWKEPPILQKPDEERKIGGRTYKLFFDGTRMRIVSWQTSKGTYWIANTLLRTLTNKQMLGLASSVKKIG
jgi:polyisoprenyl-teichoic acid--peptidoglycan teichoic acid transferase